jgi:hypothetical protein
VVLRRWGLRLSSVVPVGLLVGMAVTAAVPDEALYVLCHGRNDCAYVPAEKVR